MGPLGRVVREASQARLALWVLLVHRVAMEHQAMTGLLVLEEHPTNRVSLALPAAAIPGRPVLLLQDQGRQPPTLTRRSVPRVTRTVIDALVLLQRDDERPALDVVAFVHDSGVDDARLLSVELIIARSSVDVAADHQAWIHSAQGVGQCARADSLGS